MVSEEMVPSLRQSMRACPRLRTLLKRLTQLADHNT